MKFTLTVLLIGMAIHSFVLSFLLWQGTTHISAGQQLIAGILMLVFASLVFVIEKRTE